MNLFTYVKSKLSILDVIGQYVTLKKAGLYYKGNCPFHHEKTASFSVSPHKEIFYCFGCHLSGDVISFIASIEHLSQKDAAEHIIERFGLEIPETFKFERELPKSDEKKRYFELITLVAQWAHKNLETHPSAQNYFLKRGFTNKTLSLFNIGYFPGGQQAIKNLSSFLASNNLLVDDLITAHIITQGKQVRYSPFEERLLFPIKDHVGRMCGFGGRIFKEQDERAKYYNSHENQFFNKGSLFFGFDLAKHSMQEKGTAFMVEGYTDCMAMHQYGYTNTIATLGTACTLDHLKIISRYVNTLYITYDGDQAGQKAMLRLAELCWEVNLDPRVICLPADEDPASFLINGNSLQSYIAHAKDIFLFYIDHLGSSFSAQSLSEKLKNTQKLIAMIKNIPDNLKRDLLLQQASETLGIPFDSLRGELMKAQATHVYQVKPEESSAQTNPVAQISLLEKKLFSVIMSDVTLLQKTNNDYVIKHFGPPLSDILERFCKAQEDGTVDFVAFFDTLPEHEQRWVSQILLECEDNDPSKTFEHLLIQFQKKHWKAIVHDIKLKLNEAEQEEDDTKVKEILLTFQELKKRLLSKGLL